jgi:hypothetical protein
LFEFHIPAGEIRGINLGINACTSEGFEGEILSGFGQFFQLKVSFQSSRFGMTLNSRADMLLLFSAGIPGSIKLVKFPEAMVFM